MPGLYFYDVNGVPRSAQEIWFYDAAGVPTKVKGGYFYDTSGNVQKFFGGVLGEEAFYMPGIGPRPTSGTTAYFQFTVPAGVTLMHIAVVSAGGSGAIKATAPKGSGGGGGALVYSNDIVVTPGEVLRIYPGGGGAGKTGGSAAGTAGQASYVQRNTGANIVNASGGNAGTTTAGGAGGGMIAGQVSGAGGAGATGASVPAGGGGAGGYSGTGGSGAAATNGTGGSGGGGGGGAGGWSTAAATRGGMGGGVGIFGVGTSGAGGTYVNSDNALQANGKSGSGGADPPLNVQYVATQQGAGLFGGGGAGSAGSSAYSGYGGGGAVMLRWGASPPFPTLMLPVNQLHDFVMTPATVTNYIAATTSLQVTGEVWSTVGTINPFPPCLKQQVAMNGLASYTTDPLYVLLLGGLSAPINSIAELQAIFRRIEIDGLGYLDAADADINPLSYLAARGEQTIEWSTNRGTCTIWTTGVPRTCRVLY